MFLCIYHRDESVQEMLAKRCILSFQEHPVYVHTWKLPTTVWSSGYWAAPVEQLEVKSFKSPKGPYVGQWGKEQLFYCLIKFQQLRRIIKDNFMKAIFSEYIPN